MKFAGELKLELWPVLGPEKAKSPASVAVQAVLVSKSGAAKASKAIVDG